MVKIPDRRKTSFSAAGIKKLFDAIKSDLPDEYQSIQGMARFLQELSAVFHSLNYALKKAEGKAKSPEKYRACWMAMHLDSGTTHYLGDLLEFAALQVGLPMDGPLHACNSVKSGGSDKLLQEALNIHTMGEDLRKNARQLRRAMNFYIGLNELKTSEEIHKELQDAGPHAVKVMAAYAKMLDYIRPDKGRKTAQLLESIALCVEKNPILILAKHQTAIRANNAKGQRR